MTLWRPRIVLIGTAILGTSLTIAGIAQSQADEGQSDAERDAAYATIRADGVARHKAFVADFLAHRRDPRALDQVPLQVAYGSDVPIRTLDGAVRNSQLIVRGAVGAVRYEFDEAGFVFTVVTFDVEERLKGASAARIEIRQAGGVTFLERENRPYLLVTEADPPLFKGDQAVLLLIEPSQGVYEVQPAVGQYRLQAGKVSVPDEAANPFEHEVTGITVEQLAARVKSSVE